MMKRLKTIIKKEGEGLEEREEEEEEGKKRQKRKVPSQSQETQLSLKIVGFLFLQGPNLFHCPILPRFYGYVQRDQTLGLIS